MKTLSLIPAILGEIENDLVLEKGPATILAGIMLGTIVLVICNLRLLILLRRGERGFSISPFPLVFGLFALWGVVSKDVLLWPNGNWYLAKVLDIALVILVVAIWESWEYSVNRFFRRDPK